MLDLHPTYLEKNGRPEFVVLPYEEFVAMREQLEDLEDLLLLEEARRAETDAPTKTLEEVRRELGL